MTSTAVSVRAETRPPIGLLAEGPLRRRRRLALPDRAGVGATMSATFLGLLMIQGLAHAEGSQGLAGDAAGPGAAGDGALPAGEVPVAGGFMADGLGAGSHGSAVGSVLSVGAILDPSLLTKLSGAARFDDGLSMPSHEATMAAAATIQSPVGAGGISRADMQLASAAADPTAEAALPVVTPPDENLGPVGENHTGGDGDDTLIGTDKDDNLNGGGGDDLIYGGNGNDLLGGNEGDDELHGDGGDDELDGGVGNDLVYGGAGNDLGHGGEGNDGVFGGADNDELYGGGGNDLVDGGNGTDELYGGTGRDTLVVDQIHDLALEDPFGADGGGIDTLEIRDGYATSLAQELPGLSSQGRATFVLNDAGEAGLPGGAEGYVQQVHPFIENVRLTGSVDHDLMGDGRDNKLIGNEGHNRIYGGGGDDWLDGGAGDDWLQGGDGQDLMYDSGGDDVFVLGLNDSAVDTIFDHSGVNTVTLAGASASHLQVSLDGQDLRIGYDGRDVATIDDYVGNESHFTGLDLGQGVLAFPDLLAEFLPRQVGSAGDDILRAADGGEWLVGKGGNDSMLGSAAADRLEGGDGSDVTSGGAGDDTYLLQKGETGIDRISDTQGRNTVELSGHEGSAVQGFMVQNDLWITADSQPIAIVEGHGSDPGSFQGVRIGDRMVDPHELMS